MIGSLMSRMGMAEKLSVAQLQKAVQDGTLPAYVGIPLLQDKMQKEQAARTAASGMQQPQGEPPIAEQVMQAAQAQQGIDAAPSNLPEQGFAGGGIVAFAAGGDAEDDDEEDYVSDEDRQQAELLGLMRAGEDRLHQGIESGEGFGINAALPQAGYKGEGIKPPEGVEGLRAYILQKESGGRDYDTKGNPLTSPKGAKYAMQVMEGTARDPGFGIAPAKDKSAAEYNRVGDEYVNALYNKYQDPKLAAMAYNWGPGNVDKWLAGGRKGPVPEETRKYVASLAGGGIVALADGGDFPTAEEIEAAKKPYTGYPQLGPKAGAPKPVYPETSIMDLLVPKTYPIEEAKKAAEKKPAPEEVKKEVKKDVDADIASTVAANIAKEEPQGIKAVAPVAAPEDDIRKKYLEMLTKREAGAANQRSIDNYTALLQAGLGMMGSKSLTPLGAIGEGASSGIAAKLAAEKTRAAEEAATLKGYGNLYTAEQAAKMRQTLAGQGQEAALRKQQFGVMANLEQKTRAQIANSLDKSIDVTGMTPEQKQAKVDQLTAQALNNLPAYKAAYKAYNGFDYTAAPVIPAAVDYGSTYGLTPKPKQ